MNLTKENVSVIVPIYKVEPYLRQCVDSILNQTYQKLEIILVDDGSPDGCPTICDEYAALDPRVKVIHKPNGGLSDARNAGLDIAAGEYIAFVDSDDWIAPDYVEMLYTLLTEHGADISGVGLCSFMDSTAPEPQQTDAFYVGAGAVLLGTIFEHGFVQSWAKLYRAGLFQELRFPKGMLYEDYYLTPRLCLLAQKIVLSGEQLYYYRQRNDSIMGSRFVHEDLVRIADENIELLKTELEEKMYLRCFAVIKGHLNARRDHESRSEAFDRLFFKLEEKYQREIRRTHSSWRAYKYSRPIVRVKEWQRRLLGDAFVDRVKKILRK